MESVVIGKSESHDKLWIKKTKPRNTQNTQKNERRDYSCVRNIYKRYGKMT